jgi:hypothetical protein
MDVVDQNGKKSITEEISIHIFFYLDLDYNSYSDYSRSEDLIGLGFLSIQTTLVVLHCYIMRRAIYGFHIHEIS